jgi:hypothetical protein
MELMRIDKGYAGVRVQSNGVLHSVLLLAGARKQVKESLLAFGVIVGVLRLHRQPGFAGCRSRSG